MRKSLLPVLAASGAVVVFGLLVLRMASGQALPLAVILLVGAVCTGVIVAVLWIDRREKLRMAPGASVPRVRAVRRLDPLVVGVSLAVAVLIAYSTYALFIGRHALVLGLGPLLLVVLLGILARRLLPAAETRTPRR